MGFVDDEHDLLASFGFLSGEGVGGLGDERGFVEPGDTSEGGDDGGVEAAGADGGVAHVDDGVATGVQRGERGPRRDGLAGADLTGEHAEGAFVDTPGDAGDGFAVGAVGVQHGGGEVFAERHAGQAPVGAETVDAHGPTSVLAVGGCASSSSGRASWE